MLTMDQVRASFLAHASQKLFTVCPTTSAHLSLQSLELQRARGNNLDRDICKSCGTLSVSGVTSERRPSGPLGTRDRKAVSSSPKEPHGFWIDKCTRCGRETWHQYMLRRKPSARRHRKSDEATSATTRPPSPVQHSGVQRSSAPEPKLSNKKRAKARNDRSSLQALLSKSNQVQRSTTLSFSDLMKK